MSIIKVSKPEYPKGVFDEPVLQMNSRAKKHGKPRINLCLIN